MLVLTRKIGQRIQLGNNISLTVVRVKGGQVRVGIEAPKEIGIYRGEIANLGQPQTHPMGLQRNNSCS